MKDREIAALIEQPDLHSRLLGDYQGAYSLGITRSPDDENEYALLLRVESYALEDMPREILIDGHKIPVVVCGEFTAPRAL